MALANEVVANLDTSAAKMLPGKAKSKLKPAEAWYPTGAPLSGKGELWEQGTSMQELNRRRIPQKATNSSKQNLKVNSQNNAEIGANTRAGVKSQLKSIAEYERKLSDKPITIGNTAIHGEPIVDESTWRPTITEPVKIDETVLNSQRSVVGAYAHMVEDGNFTMSAGPELHLQENINTPLDDDGPPQGSEVGMGMKLRWGF